MYTKKLILLSFEPGIVNIIKNVSASESERVGSDPVVFFGFEFLTSGLGFLTFGYEFLSLELGYMLFEFKF